MTQNSTPRNKVLGYVGSGSKMFAGQKEHLMESKRLEMQEKMILEELGGAYLQECEKRRNDKYGDIWK